MKKCHQFINGNWLQSQGPEFDSINPATGKVIWQGREATEDEVQQAVTAACQAFPAWSALSIEERIKGLERFREQLIDNRDHLVLTIAKENGKPLWEAQTELGATINKLEVSIVAHAQRTGEVTESLNSVVSMVRHKAHGVMAVMGPFNFPTHLPNGHIIPALLAGNTVVFKPSEQTPLVAEEYIKCWEKAKLPMGVLNLVQGGRTTGECLVNSDINGLLFTGSYATGKSLHEKFSGHIEKMLALELGGNNPLVIHEINDSIATAYLTIQSAFITAGQRCTCARRLIVVDNQRNQEFIETLVKMSGTIQIGAYSKKPEPFMGPVISSQQANKLLEKQAKLIKAGANSLLTMKLLQENTGLLSPGIIDVTNVSNRKDEEIFGPLLQVIWVDSFDAAIIEANNTHYGLVAGLLSDDIKCFKQFYRTVNAGLINWNHQLTGATSNTPFGGIGYSGNHRPSAFYAADYCAYPVSGLQRTELALPEKLTPGINVND